MYENKNLKNDPIYSLHTTCIVGTKTFDNSADNRYEAVFC